MDANRRIWWLVAAIGLVTTILHAERLLAEPITLPYCIERSKLAIDIAKTVQGGLTMDRINLEYAIPPTSEDEDRDRQAWVAELKGEIAVLMQTVQDPEMVGQTVLENCAYAYGKLRRTATVADEAWCRNRMFDINRIAKFVSDGAPVEQVKAFARRSPELRGDRLDAVIEMIDEAYAWQGPFIEWMKMRYADCAGAGT